MSHEHHIKLNHLNHAMKPKSHHEHHVDMIKDFKKRFWSSLILTIPVLFLSSVIQQFLQIEKIIAFKGDIVLLFIFSTIIFFTADGLF